MTTDDRLAQIRARVESATEGPWEWRDGIDWVGRVLGPEYELADTSTFADAEFIAAAREDVPWLLAEVERLRRNVYLLRRDQEAFVSGHLADHLTGKDNNHE